MKRTAKKTLKEREVPGIDPRFLRVVAAFARDRQVGQGNGKGFGSRGLKVKGKIFAMMSSKGKFVVKLPKERVDELVSAGKGDRFDPGHVRLMKEWVAVGPGGANVVELAKDAYHFVKRAKP